MKRRGQQFNMLWMLLVILCAVLTLFSALFATFTRAPKDDSVPEETPLAPVTAEPAETPEASEEPEAFEEETPGEESGEGAPGESPDTEDGGPIAEGEGLADTGND